MALRVGLQFVSRGIVNSSRLLSTVPRLSGAESQIKVSKTSPVVSDWRKVDFSLRKSQQGEIEKMLQRRVVAVECGADPDSLEMDNARLLHTIQRMFNTDVAKFVVATLKSCGVKLPVIMRDATDTSLLEKEATLKMGENGIATVGGECIGLVICEIDKKIYMVPLQVNESSVVAGCQAYAKKAKETVTLKLGPQVMGTQVIMLPKEKNDRQSLEKIQTKLLEPSSFAKIEQYLLENVSKYKSLKERHGGGLTGKIQVNILDTDTGPQLELILHFGTGQMMGANVANLIAEPLRKFLPTVVGPCIPYAGILSNVAYDGSEEGGRIVKTRTTYDLDSLARDGMTGRQVAERVVALSAVARESFWRGSTDAKGTLNTLISVLKVFGQDTEAVMAGLAHYMAMNGKPDAPLRPFTNWRIEGDELIGEITTPAHLSGVGTVQDNPIAMKAFKLAGIVDESGNVKAVDIGRLSNAMALYTNLAALISIISDKGNSGHHLGHTTNADSFKTK